MLHPVALKCSCTDGAICNQLSTNDTNTLNVKGEDRQALRMQSE